MNDESILIMIINLRHIAKGSEFFIDVGSYNFPKFLLQYYPRNFFIYNREPTI